jgi:LmbE family N-acetylglucosaminyl deacetylase
MLTHVYLSPHLDDAVLSCGGMIHQQARAGERVVVVTVCAGDPPPGPLSGFTLEHHSRWETPADAAAARRAEDRAALDRLRAEAVHLRTPDCIYRADPATGRHLYTSREALFGDVPPAEAALVERTAGEIAGVLRGVQSPRLYVPLGIGNHVDHQLTRRAAELRGGVFAYFEDYPYAAQEWGAASPAPGRALTPETVPLSEADLAAKVEAIAAYVSQISTFWNGLAEMEAAVRQFAGQTGGGPPAERIWRAG